MLELADATALLTVVSTAVTDAFPADDQVVFAALAGCAGAALAALGLRGLRLRAARGHDPASLHDPATSRGGLLRGGRLSALASVAGGARRDGDPPPPAAGFGLRLEGDRLRARDRAARAFLGDDEGPIDAFVRRLTPVEGAMDLGLALRTLEADGRPFRSLADDDEGRSWEVAGRPEAGEARLELTSAGPARREIARLRGMLAVLASDRDQASEALEAAPLLAWRRSPAGAVIWGNALYRRIAAAEEAHGSDAAPLPELHHDGGEARGSRPPEGRRSVFDARTGERRWYELAELPASDGGALGYGIDAAAAVHAEGALRRFVETLTETFAHLAIGLAIFDRETRLGLFNPAFASLMRLDPAWLAGRPSLSDVIERLRADRRLPDHEDFQLWRATMLDLFRTDGVHDRPESTEVWHLPGEVQIRVVARPHPQGAVAFLFEDVSETARLERRFSTETETRRAVMDRLEEGVVAFGPDGVARFVNPAFAAIWRRRDVPGPASAAAGPAARGDRPGERRGDRGDGGPGDRLEGLLDGLLDAGLEDALAAGQGGADPLRLPRALELFRARSDAGAVWDRLAEFFGAPTERAAWSEEVSLLDGRRLRVRVAALPDGSVLATFTDVTDATRAERAMRERTAALEAAEEIRGALLEQVSNRVRTPLARIQGLGLALRDAAEDQGAEPAALERIDAILEAASQVQTALSGVADLASAQAGVLSLTPETVDLRAALVAALDMAQRRAAERGVILSLESGDPYPDASAAGTAQSGSGSGSGAGSGSGHRPAGSGHAGSGPSGPAPAGTEPSGPEHVVGDAARVRQLLFNLVTDAVHRSGKGDEVRAGARRRGADVEIWTDAPEPAAEAPDASRGGGLAQALARRFTELHGGALRIERHDDAGAPRRRVICTLPAEVLRARAPASPPTSTAVA